MKCQLPFWKILRKILKLGLIFSLVGLITTLLVIVALSPRCEEKPKLLWWQNSIIFKIDMDEIKRFNSLNAMYSPIESLIFI